MRVRVALFASVVLAFSVAACSDDDPAPGGDTIDAATNVPDADPNAPDADPSAPDANVNAPDANPNAPDANTAGGADAAAGGPGVECGGATCTADTQECCITGMIGSQTQTCVATGTCAGSTLTCDGPEDCSNGDVCCGRFSGGGGGGGSATTTCEANCNGGQSAVLCRTETDCPSAAPMCCSSFVFTSNVCRTTCGF